MTFRILGILNITPDSFSDGGLYHSSHQAIKRAHELKEQGADWVDVGAESTRPGSKPVSTEEEWNRLEPVLKNLQDIPFSLDTANPEIMIRALDYNVDMINCTAGVVEDHVLQKLAKQNVHYVAMHRYGDSQTMQKNPLTKENVHLNLETFYAKSWKKLHSAGFSPGKIWLDPGYGFGKDIAAQTSMMASTRNYSLQYQLVVGISRKSWVGSISGVSTPSERDTPSRMLEVGLIFAGAKMIRSHDVRVLEKIRGMLK